jgi:hypothetical protein
VGTEHAVPQEADDVDASATTLSTKGRRTNPVPLATEGTGVFMVSVAGLRRIAVPAEGERLAAPTTVSPSGRIDCSAVLRGLSPAITITTSTVLERLAPPQSPRLCLRFSAPAWPGRVTGRRGRP